VCLGQIVWVWEKLERQANEMLDTVIYASAAAYRHGVQAISDVGWQKPREQWET
jgi:phage terminase large subunit GpA-like protein